MLALLELWLLDCVLLAVLELLLLTLLLFELLTVLLLFEAMETVEELLQAGIGPPVALK